MKYPNCIAILFLSCVVACSPPPAPVEEDADTTGADRTAIEDMTDPYVTAYNAQDLEALLAFYDDQVVLMPSGAPAMTGHASVRARMEQIEAQGTPELSISPEETIVSGDIAFTRGSYALTITPESGTPIQEDGKYLSVWRKLPDGSWKISRQMTNSNAMP